MHWKAGRSFLYVVIESVNNLALYLDGNLMSTRVALSNYRNIQLNAILAANKKIYGLICIAAIGMMIYVVQHHFGKVRFSRLGWKQPKFTKVLRKKKNDEEKILQERLEEIEDAAGATF